MKKVLMLSLILLSTLTMFGCSKDEVFIPTITIENNNIELTVGDEFDELGGVTASGLEKEDVRDLLTITHSIPLDDAKHVTTEGTYTVTYTLTINDIEYKKEAIVTVVKADESFVPIITIEKENIELTIGDEFDEMDGVSAKGLENEDVTNLITVSHSIPLDAGDLVTTEGTYTVTYTMIIDGYVYTKVMTVTIVKEDVVIDDSIIVNGDFETGNLSPFTKSDFEGANSTMSVVEMDGNHLLKLDITAVSWNSAAPRIEYKGLDLDSNKFYELTFDAFADEARAMHMQIGQLLDADPWYKAAFGEIRYFNLTSETQTFTWRFQVSSDVASADLKDLALLFGFGSLENQTSTATVIYLDNISIEETTSLEADTIAPVLVFKEDKSSFFEDDYFTKIIEKYVAVVDERGETLEILIDEDASNIPTVNEDDSRLNETGSFNILFYAIDAAGNKGTIEWTFVVEEKYPATNGFNFIDFLRGGGGDITEGNTHYGYVYAGNPETTWEYKDGVLTIKSTQDQNSDPWTATQVFLRTVRQEGFYMEGAKKFTLSFDVESDVEGYIQVNELPFKIEVGTTHIAIEGNIFNYNYKNLTIVLGVHANLLSPQQNIGACEVSISNFSFVNTHELDEDIIPPVLLRNVNKTYFVGDSLNLLSTVRLFDFRGSYGATIEVVDSESDTIPLIDGKVTTPGTYHVTFLGTDASGNQAEYTFEYIVKANLINSNGFGIEAIEFGEEWAIDDPSVVFLWHDGNVNVTSTVIDQNNFTFTSDQSASDVPWYATQLFFKSMNVDTYGLYNLSFNIVSNVSGHITVMGESIEIKVGINHIDKKVAVQPGEYQKITMQLGANGYGTIGACEIEIRNLALTLENLSDDNVWEGYGMTVDNVDGEAKISYSGIGSEWWSKNARTYIFDATPTFEAIVIEFIGTAGHTYQFKIEGINPAIFNASSIIATGETQTVIIDTRNRTEEQRLSLYNLLVFVESVGTSGTVTVKNVSMYEEFENAFDTKWLGMGMSVEDIDTLSHVTYTNVSSEWWNANAQLPMDGEFTASSTSVSFTFTGIEGHNYLFKVEGGGYSIESPFVATGSLQTFNLDISSLGDNTAKIKLAVFFCKTIGASGTAILGEVTVQ